MRWTVDALVEICGGELLHRGGRAAVGAFIDSRAPIAEGLFVPIVATRDGHDFIPSALRGGAAAVLVGAHVELADEWSDLARELDASLVRVDDTLVAFSALARAVCGRIPGPRVAITGSNGKTTTRSMIAALAQHHFGAGHVLSTRGNLNNHLGVPLTVHAEPHQAEVAVLELGMSAPGENDHLAAIVQPTLAVVTSVALEHLESMGSLEAIAKAELEPVARLPQGAALVMPAGQCVLDEALAGYARPDLRVIRVGLEDEAGAEVIVSHVRLGAVTRARVRWADGRALELRLQGFGVHNARNAAMACAVAAQWGMPCEAMADVLAEVETVGDRGRLLEWRSPSGRTIWVLADCYNANPGSMTAAISSCAALRAEAAAEGADEDEGVRVRELQLYAVLGDMLELGPTSDRLHAELGDELVDAGFSGVVGVGPGMAACVANASALDESVHVAGVEDIAAIMAPLRDWLGRDGPGPALVLVKGSRGIALERVVAGLQSWLG